MRPECPTSAGLARQLNGARMLLAVSVGVCWCVHHQRWVGKAAERCLDATSSVVCVGVGVSPKMHHQRWVGRAAERCLDATSSVGGTPPPRDALQCALAEAVHSVR